jgi:hypothetical protein
MFLFSQELFIAKAQRTVIPANIAIEKKTKRNFKGFDIF